MGRKIYDEDLRLNLILNGEGLNQGSKKMVAELGKMEMEMVKMEQQAKMLAASIKNLEKNAGANAVQLKQQKAEYNQLTQTMKSHQLSIEAMRKQVGLAGMTVEQLRNHLNALKVQLFNMPGSAGSPMFKQLQKEITETNIRLTTLTTGASRMAQAWSRLEQTINKAGTIVGWFAMIIYGLTRIVGGVITRMKDLEDLIGNVRKNTGLLVSEVWEMKDAFDKWDTRTSTDDLLKLATVMGKLGIEGKENIMKFVDAANMIQVALGDDLNGSVEDTVNSVGKLTNAFRVFDKINEKTGKNFTLDEAMLRTGDVLNDLAKSSAASAGTILEYMTRLAGVGELAGFTVAQIAGIGSVLDSMNVPSERGATALQKIMLQLANPKKIQDFGEALGLVGNASESVAVQYEKMLKNDPNAVLLGLMQKFVSTKDGLIELTGGLQQFGVRGQYMTAVLGSMAQNIDVIIQQQAVATKAWKDGTSVLSEYNIMNNNFTAEVLKQQKVIRAQTDQMNKDAEPAVLALVTAWTKFVVGIRETVAWIGRHWGAIKLLTFAYIALKAPLLYSIGLQVSERIGSALLTAQIQVEVLWRKLQCLWTKDLSIYQLQLVASSNTLRIANLLLTGQFRRAWIELRLLTATMATSKVVIGGVVFAVAALAAAFYFLVLRKKELTEADKINKALHEKINEDYFKEKGNLNILIDRLKDVNISNKERGDIIKQIQDQYGDYLPSLKKEGITAEEVAGSYDKLVDAMGRKVVYENAKEAAIENNAKMLVAKTKLDEAQAKYDEVKKRYDNRPLIATLAGGADVALKKAEKDLIRFKANYQQFFDLDQKLKNDLAKAGPKKEVTLSGVDGLRKAAAENIAERNRLNDEINAAQAAIDLKNKVLKGVGYDANPEEAALKIKVENVKRLASAYEKIQTDLSKIQLFSFKDEGYDTFKQRQEALKSEFEAEELLIKQNGLKSKKNQDTISEELRQAKIKYLRAAIDDREKSWRTEAEEEKAYFAMQNELVDLQLQGQGELNKAKKKELKDDLLELENAYGMSQAAIKNRYLRGEIESEDEYNDEMLILELEFLAKKMNLYKVGTKEYLDAYNELLSKKIAVEKSIEGKIETVQKQYAKIKIDRLGNDIDKAIAIENDRWQEELVQLENQLIAKKVLSEKEFEFNWIVNKTIEAKALEHEEKMRKIRSIADEKEINRLKNSLDALTQIGNLTNWQNDQKLKAFYQQKSNLIKQQYEKERLLAGENQQLLNAADQNYSQQSFDLDKEMYDAEMKMNASKISMIQSYISALRGIVGEQSDIGKALFLLSQGIAIADVWIKTAATNAIIYSTALAEFAYLGPAAPLAAAGWAAAPLAANNTNAALQTGLILAQTIGEVAQWATGKYPVIGASDGRYYNASDGGSPRTGVYSQPTLLNMIGGRSLVGERAPELVVDGDTFRRIQLNAPGLLQDIYAYAGRGDRQPVRQMAEGSYPGPSNSSPASGSSSVIAVTSDPELKKVMKELNKTLKEGVHASINKYGTNGLMEALDDIAKLKSKVSTL